MSAAPGPPLFAQAHTAWRQGRLQDARRLLDTLLRREPDNADAWNLFGIVLQVQRDPATAVRCFERSLQLQPTAGVRVNLGFALQKLGRDADALQVYADAARQDPKLAIAWQKLGGLHEQRGEREPALAAYRRAVELDPDDLKSLGDALYLRRHLADWSDPRPPTPAQLLATFARAPRSDFSPGLLLSLPEADAATQKAAAAKFARSQWAAALAAAPLAPSARAHDGPLRIGYLSADFCNHAVSFLTLETIAAHDRANVHVSLYGYRTFAADDPWRAMAVAIADRFTDIDALDDHAAARRIAADGIDVLIDLTGYTGSARSGINALRPAPVIAHWLGYIGTLGEPRLADYVIGDAIATPPASAAGFSEALALMPRCYQPNGVLRPPAEPPARSAEGLPADAVVFCSFNQTYKLNPLLWDDWCEALRGVPGSVLWLVAPRDPAGRANLQREAAARGVDPARLVFAPPRSRAEHLARLPLADLALDTWPYNSGTTASDALRCGVPLLAFAGTTFVGRMAASLLQAAGLGDTVLSGRTDVVREAIRLGNDADARTALRRRVATAIAASTLFEPALFARDLERLYAAMHANALAGRREHIVLDAG